jgi:uncharacterized protein YihD (DUF1040 family)
MRDPNRIPKMIAALLAAWYRHPDLRLGQLVSSAAALSSNTSDPFYVEDDKIIEGLKKLAEQP